MIYIKEKELDSNSIEIWVDGILDHEGLPILIKISESHLAGGKRITLHLEGIVHMSREGRDFLNAIKNRGVVLEALRV
jgi:hypothetical protein